MYISLYGHNCRATLKQESGISSKCTVSPNLEQKMLAKITSILELHNVLIKQLPFALLLSTQPKLYSTNQRRVSFLPPQNRQGIAWAASPTSTTPFESRLSSSSEGRAERIGHAYSFSFSTFSFYSTVKKEVATFPSHLLNWIKISTQRSEAVLP